MSEEQTFHLIDEERLPAHNDNAWIVGQVASRRDSKEQKKESEEESL